MSRPSVRREFPPTGTPPTPSTIPSTAPSRPPTGAATAYLYDAAQQLSEIHDSSDTGTLTGAAVHDADGHLVKLCENGTVTKTTGDCTSTGTGSTTLALVWDALDHLNTATRTGANAITESYAYDDSGRRIQKVSGTTTTSYLYDGDAIHAEWNGAINGNPTAVYVHGAGIDEPLLRLTGTTSGPAATEAAYLQDGLGSVIGTANASGTLTANQRFDAWGNKTTSSGTVPTYGYTGREPDATGLAFYRNRYYHPGLGRFVSRDPMGMADAVSPYAYVANNPINVIDPMGLLAQLTGTAPPEAYWGMTADASGWVHGALGAASFCPSLCGSAFSAIDAGVYGWEGDKVSAGISLAAAAAGIVTDAGAVKLGLTVGKEIAEGAIVAKSAGQLGREGEAAIQAATGLSKNTETFVVNGRNRIPDFVSARDPVTNLPTQLIESKNVQYQSLTKQLRDYGALVGESGRVDIALPPGARVSGPLQNAFDNPRNPLFRIDIPQ